MTLAQLNLGSVANDGTGDDLRTAGGKINTAFAAVDGLVAGSIAAMKINILADSLGAQSAYYPYGTSLANAPAYPGSGQAVTLGQLCLNNGLVYRCSVSGTTGTGTPPTGNSGSPVADGTASWVYVYWNNTKFGNDPLFWAEALSLGRLDYDQTLGYQGVFSSLGKIIVIAGGIGYSNTDTLTLPNGATASIVVDGNGTITSVPVINGGYDSGTQFTYSINTSTGSGAVLSVVEVGHGTFAVPGCQTPDIVARLPDVAASIAEIIAVLCGTNDLTSVAVTAANINARFSLITGNLKTSYETLMGVGKIVVAMPIPPRTGLSAMQIVLWHRVNRWIRQYVDRRRTTNTKGYGRIVLADTNRYLLDGTTTGINPIGGSAAGAGAMCKDGLHQSQRGAFYEGLAIVNALLPILSVATSGYRDVGMSDGFDYNLNPGGNAIESAPWQASSNVVLQQACTNGTNVYRCKAAGVTASSGGPTGTGSTIADGSAQWAYVRPAGGSVFNSGVTAAGATGPNGTINMASTIGSVTLSGNIDSSWFIARPAGSAAGTLAASIESPYSDGQVGNRQVLAFSLGSGSNNEWWAMYTSQGVNQYGIVPSDLGVTQWYAMAEIELSNIANVIHVDFEMNDNNGYFRCQAGTYLGIASSVSLTIPNSSGEMLAYPNGGKLLLKTAPMVLPAQIANLQTRFGIAFNAAGGAGSATLTAKINYAGLFPYEQA